MTGSEEQKALRRTMATLGDAGESGVLVGSASMIASDVTNS